MAETTEALPMPFDLELICERFTKCKRDDGTIGMDDYLDGYTELTKFFELFGTVFGFVVSDVTSKLAILREHRASNCSPHYITIQSMVDFEVDTGITKTKAKLPSGSRTLLRLHRALEFIILFIRKIEDCPEEAKLSEIANDAYNTTLSKYHPWIIRKGVGLALYILPTKGQLMERLNMDGDKAGATEQFARVVSSAQPVYDIVQKVYIDNAILNLP